MVRQIQTIGTRPDSIAGIESRGFLFAAPLATMLSLPLVLIRKKGKTPGKVIHHHSTSEYGAETLEVSAHSIQEGQSVLVVDDVLATGGTAGAACDLINKAGGLIAACLFLIKLLS